MQTHRRIETGDKSPIALREIVLGLFITIKPFVPAVIKKAARSVLPPSFARYLGASYSIQQPAKRVKSSKRVQPSKEVSKAGVAMFAGFSVRASQDLERALYHPRSSQADRSEAAHALAKLDLLEKNYSRALDRFAAAFAGDPRRANSLQSWVLHFDALVRSGRLDQAAEALNTAPASVLQRSEYSFCKFGLHLAMAHSGLGTIHFQRALNAFNEPFTAAGLASIALLDDRKPLALGNLTSTAEPMSTQHPFKVSVLMPAFNCSNTLEYAARSVLSQTWSNLELIIVDDASQDDTLARAHAIAASDPRVLVLEQQQNRGAYAARNLALHSATGKFVTVHDSDDWSHPQRIELQVQQHIADPDKCLTCTYGLRVNQSLEVQTKPTDGAQIVMNTSSLLYDRELLLSLGGWHELRLGADSELMHRVISLQSAPARRLMSSVPLALLGVAEGSLTQAGATSVIKSVKFGARRDYSELYKTWHSQNYGHGGRIDTLPVPNVFRPNRKEVIDLDILFVSDFSLTGGTNHSNIAMMTAARDLGMKIAILHWPRYANAGAIKNRKILQYLVDHGVPSIVGGETVQCRLAIVNHPNLLMDRPDPLPAVKAGRCVVVINQAPVTRTVGGRIAYDPAVALSNAETFFGCPPVVAPLSGTIREILTDFELPYEITAINWTPLIDAGRWKRDGYSPFLADVIVGRHSRDHVDKWPDQVSDIEGAYCVDRPASMRILGGAKVAVKTLGRRPENWSIIPFGDEDPNEFLRGLDVYVYYPHPDIIEAFGRAPMEAMATGVPVILPKSFEPMFGPACLYSEPAEVWDMIVQLQKNSALYRKQVALGLRFIDENCDVSQFESRIEPLLWAQEVYT